MVFVLLKVLVAPLLVLAGSWAQRRLGPVVGGRIVGLPLTSLPLLALMTMSQGRHFAAEAAASTLAGGVAQSVWALAYALAARRRSASEAALLATAGFAAVSALLYQYRLPLAVAALVSALSVVAALVCWPSPPAARRGADGAGHPLAARMVAAAGFTFAVAESAAALGARPAGLVGALPVLSAVLAVGVHRQQGAAASIRFLQGVVEGSLSVVAALAVLTYLLAVAGPLMAFAMAIGASLLAQMIPLGRVARLRDLAEGNVWRRPSVLVQPGR